MYKIVAEAKGQNTSYAPETAENKGGIVIYLQKVGLNDGGRQEVERVAFDRSRSKNPRVPFDVQLDKSLTKARAAVKSLNELLNESGELV